MQIWPEIKEAFLDAYDAAFDLLALNLLWIFFSLLIITLPVATAGLFYATHEIAHRRPGNWRTFFTGFRQYFWLGLQWSLVNLVVIGLLVFNFVFYGRLEATWAPWLQGVVLGGLFLWGLLQLYTFPLLLEQEERRFTIAMRNSFVLLIRYPRLSLMLFVFLIVLAVASTVLTIPWFLLTVSLSAFLTCRAVVDMVRHMHGEPMIWQRSSD